VPWYQHARLLRAAVAVAALTAAVGGETAVGRSLAERGAEHTGRPPVHGAAFEAAAFESAAFRTTAVGSTAVGARSAPADRADRALPASGRGAVASTGPLPVEAVPWLWPAAHPRQLHAAAVESPVAASSRVRPVPGASTLLALPARLDRDGVGISVGSAHAPVVLELYEDYRCPTCRRFELAQGRMLGRLASDGTVRIRYIIESSLDVRLPGRGAHRAANAARAALEYGGFPLYHALLLRNQPSERVNAFSVNRLLAIASHVRGLRGPGFDRAVRNQRYSDWVNASQRAYERYGRRFMYGTPGLVVNGRPIDLGAHPELMTDPDALRALLKRAAHHHR
jgi:protein-disulfide isomerase